MNHSKVADVVKALQDLTDDELASVVSSISADYGNNVSSTMGAMCYLFTVAPLVYRTRKGTIRYQAANSKDK